MPRILIVEDEDIIRSAVRKLLQHAGYEVADAVSVEEAEGLDPDSFDLVITDLRLPGAAGTEMINRAPNTPVLIMTSYASLRSAVDSMKMGAVDYIAKPFDHDEMLAAVENILARKSSASDETTGSGDATSPSGPDSDPSEIMFGQCEPMQKVFTLIRKVAPTETTVLIQGESGTGKELAARALHLLSPRASKPLISVNCAAIPESLIESELFGHEKGAFTGAVSARTGLIEAADGGSLFLDEIGELPAEAQARLLRVLQESEIRKVGSTQSRTVDVRMIAATHRNLKAMTRTGEFREDLYYRLNVMQIRIPPLRERRADILGLARRFLKRQASKLGRPELSLSPEAMQALERYRWPGNVRELENAIERASILTDGDVITPAVLDLDSDSADEYIPETLVEGNNEQTPARDVDSSNDLSLEDYFQHFVLENQDRMSETELAQKLGISRKSLWERRQRLGIPRKKA
ncbi:sigma-54-dependent transcriptional regulator [Marinobacter nauticus]|jgi:Two-component response regulator CbrB|uniref:Two-component response regulator CbrB n=1 Tax=Marinobacter nauticus (strain ATCC 700491 / DSM 11845 / VT8) TaxID=351348 RepID=A1TYE9_MARN8|nr:sigma-54 dependent transcriptional regulator [Marinobacter nauticus]ABM17768.1 Two-component response regulator CbrB [Marinobacter nauticus VT8]MBY5939155.1 sigma-54 dependent transcriptional regulator [Marinobacter nauticus]MBY5956350.1 sigma-54 dependent transcriptional regulator [Marinobacter nauticus]MBY6010141.1 sigma-54 dependent transcriptional regulator [Marinobacter nauticus]TPW22351.1 sigma-54-dependent Fis family transcriptional regulator [Marinobacter nauticus]